MSIQLQILPEQDLPAFKRDMQESFQKGAEAEYGSISAEILPESHINASLSKPGSVAYAAFENGCMVGGAIVQIDAQTRHNNRYYGVTRACPPLRATRNNAYTIRSFDVTENRPLLHSKEVIPID